MPAWSTLALQEEKAESSFINLAHLKKQGDKQMSSSAAVMLHLRFASKADHCYLHSSVLLAYLCFFVL